ncbi:MAG: prepilin-type N-terminal cleavage/methylation domain-containing protein [Thermodesulfobacteriota bacterium]|nr:prepilin-type N-terminal cleavage/methylation domain-containing protein [Thermodesulfobacteriota bacterium]
MTSLLPATHANRFPAGFTLIEVLLAITILGIGILATASLLNSSFSTTKDQQIKVVAIETASDVADRLMALQYDSNGIAPELSDGSHVPDDTTAIPDVFSPRLPGNTPIQWSVESWDADGDGNTDTASIAIAVRWQQNPLPRTINLHCSRAVERGM